ncbi:MAG: serine acetyltransferase [Bacteroidaceae bacterium]|nr:serine acetyltransferase [Bacteroidaceae bacterium]
MNNKKIASVFAETIKELVGNEDAKDMFNHRRDGEPMPSWRVINEVVNLVRAIVFPGYFGDSVQEAHTLSYKTGMNVDRLYKLLYEQVYAGLCYGNENMPAEDAAEAAQKATLDFIAYLPALRAKLAKDVEATYNGDPAATGFGEVISCYPGVKAVSNYRMAHRLLELGVPLIPRIISEIAHSETGIDIHPGACIGEYFTIDHGTGIVIGETCIIGNNVKLYQGVTLGAKSFPLDEKGNPIKGIPRHPILEDNVIVYSNATILGRITVGKGAVIGGNIWVTDSVPAGAQIVQRK